jgi:hypothetical protein
MTPKNPVTPKLLALCVAAPALLPTSHAYRKLIPSAVSSRLSTASTGEITPCLEQDNNCEARVERSNT